MISPLTSFQLTEFLPMYTPLQRCPSFSSSFSINMMSDMDTDGFCRHFVLMKQLEWKWEWDRERGPMVSWSTMTHFSHLLVHSNDRYTINIGLEIYSFCVYSLIFCNDHHHYIHSIRSPPIFAISLFSLSFSVSVSLLFLLHSTSCYAKLN